MKKLAYKKSRYNLFVPYQDGYIIFNTFTGNIGIISPEVYIRYNQNRLSDDEVDILLKKKILIPIEYSEKCKIDKDRIVGITRSNAKAYRIWTTSACNAHCFYCFENGMESKSMEESTANKIVDYIAKRLQEKNILRIEWFGGEPLLNESIIDYFIPKLKVLCESKHCQFYNSIITNGSLIDERVAIKMKINWGIKDVQITLDGTANLYNKIKAYTDKSKYNFESVLSAIKLLSKNGIAISIRMNYTGSNYGSLLDLINFLHKELSNYTGISYYVYPIWNTSDHDFSVEACVKGKFINLLKLLVINKMASIKEVTRLRYRQRACQAWNIYHLSFLPDGQISKCCETFNRIIGNVEDGIIDEETFNYFINYELDDKCENCIFLPMCQGGCKAYKYTNMSQCFAFKDIINELLIWYVQYLQKIQ